MFAIIHLLATFIADLFKPPRRLEVENLFLRHQLNVALRRAPVPTANSKRLTATANRLILAPDERSLQVNLVRLDRNIPAEGCVASREPCPSTSTQRAAAQIPEAIGLQQR
jgi:hypothetical protein